MLLKLSEEKRGAILEVGWRLLGIEGCLEGYSDLPLKGAWRHEVSATESRLEVVESVLISQVDDRESQRDLCAFRSEEIVGTGTEIKKVSRSNSWWVCIVICSAIGRNSHTQGSPVCVGARHNRLCWGCENAATEKANLSLLIPTKR